MWKEIREDRALQLFGCAVCLAHMVAVVWWFYAYPIVKPDVLMEAIPVCWPYWPTCTDFYSSFGPYGLFWFVFALENACILGVFAFYYSHIVLGWFMLLIAFILRNLIVSVDYR